MTEPQLSLKVAIGSDHAGFTMKLAVINYLKSKADIRVEDVGTFSADRCDYPDYGRRVGEKVRAFETEGIPVLGIAICGSGIGISIACNKVSGIRCALCHDHYSAAMARKHNNANVLAFGARNTGEDIAYEMINVFFAQEFEGGRHAERVAKLDSF